MKTLELIPEKELKKIQEYLAGCKSLANDVLTTIEAIKRMPTGQSGSGGGSGSKPTTTKAQDPMTASVAAEKEILRLKNEQAKAEARITAEVTKARQQALQSQAVYKANLKIEQAEAQVAATVEGSENRRIAQLKLISLQLKGINENSEEYANLQKQALALTEAQSKAEQARGVYGRGVRNYASGFSAIGFQTQQLLREVPSAINLQQFFLAISNNLPMYADVIQQEHAKIREEIAKTGKSSTTIGKQVLRGFISWQTALIVAIALITKFGVQLINWFKDVVRGSDSARMAQEAYTNAMKEANKSAAEEISMLQSLYKASQDTSRSIAERKAAVDEIQRLYPDYLGNISDENILAGNASGAYGELTQSILKTAQARAIQNKLEELSIQRLEELQKLQQNPKGSGFFTNIAASELSTTGIYSDEFKAAAAAQRQQRAIDDVNSKYNEQIDILLDMIDVRDLIDRQEKDAGRGSRARMSNLNDERKAIEELTTAEIDARIGVIKRTLALNQATVRERMTLVNDLYDLEEEKAKELYNVQRENLIQRNIDENTFYNENGSKKSTITRVEAEKNVSKQLEALWFAYQVNYTDLVDNRIKEVRDLENEAVDKMIDDAVRLAEKRQSILDMEESDELTALAAKYAKFEISQKEYEDERLRITREYAAKRLDEELKAAEEQLAILKSDGNIDEDEKQRIIELEAEIQAMRVNIHKEANDNIISDFEKFMQEYGEKIESIKNSFLDIFGSIVEAANISTEKQLEALDKQSEDAQKTAEDEQGRIERLAEAGAISEEQKNARIALSQEQLEEREKKIDLQRRQAQARQARYEQALSLTQAAVNGGVAVVKAFADLGPIAGAIAAVAVGAAIAVQIAKIASTPIPTYAHGTPQGGHPGGPMWIGDGGRSEAVISPDGTVMKSPNRSTFVPFAAKGTVVLPSYDDAIRNSVLGATLPAPSYRPNVNITSSYKEKNVLDRLDRISAHSAALVMEMRKNRRSAKYAEFINRKIC